MRRARSEAKNPKSCDEVFERLITEGVDPDDLYSEVTHQVRERGMQRARGSREAQGRQA
jgi:transcription elongation factor Elf1